MEINHLRYFYAVARHGSFTKAADALRVSQPSISKMVRQIEEDLGVPLFNRTTRSVKLTEAGKQFQEKCASIFQEFENLKRIAEVHKLEVTGPAAFGASDNLCNHFLPAILKEFRGRYPAVRLEVNSGPASAITSEILAGVADFGIFYTPPDEASLNVKKIAFVEFVVVCGPQLLPEKKSGFTIEELSAKYEFVGSRLGDYERPFPALRMLHSLGVKPRLGVETNNQESQKRFAEEGLGYTVVPKFMVERELVSRKLTMVRIDKKIGSDLYLSKMKNRVLPKPAEVLANFVTEKIGQAFNAKRS